MKRTKPLQQKKPWPRRKVILPADATPKDILKEFEVSGLVKASTLGRPKKRRKPLRAKATGQLQVFREIWASRPHVSEVSGVGLIDPPEDPREEPEPLRAWVAQFSHVLPKGVYRRLRNDPRNILLMTWGENEFWGKWGLKVVEHCPVPYIGAWSKVVRLAEQLRDEANGLQSNGGGHTQ